MKRAKWLTEHMGYKVAQICMLSILASAAQVRILKVQTKEHARCNQRGIILADSLICDYRHGNFFDPWLLSFIFLFFCKIKKAMYLFSVCGNALSNMRYYGHWVDFIKPFAKWLILDKALLVFSKLWEYKVKKIT